MKSPRQREKKFTRKQNLKTCPGGMLPLSTKHKNEVSPGKSLVPLLIQRIKAVPITTEVERSSQINEKDF